MTKKTTLVNENVIRRWGKLANMPALTENFIDSLEEEEAMEDEMEAAEDEMEAGEDEMEAGEEAEASAEEAEAVERIVSAVVDAISDETGVEIEVEGEAGDEEAMDDMDAGMDAADELDDDADDEMDSAMRDEPAMRDPANRADEDLELEVVDDEALTEAVLKRVIERLLSRQ